jgi:hypothetical protein
VLYNLLTDVAFPFLANVLSSQGVAASVWGPVVPQLHSQWRENNSMLRAHTPVHQLLDKTHPLSRRSTSPIIFGKEGLPVIYEKNLSVVQ